MKLNPPVRRIPGHRRHDYASPLPWYVPFHYCPPSHTLTTLYVPRVPGSGKIKCSGGNWDGYLRSTGNATVLGREEDGLIVDFAYEQGAGIRPMSNLAIRNPVWQIAPYLAAGELLMTSPPPRG